MSHRTYMIAMKKMLCAAMLLVLATLQAAAQGVALKTNALYWATTTPNIGLEVQTGRKHTAQIFYGLNPWAFSESKKVRHWLLQPEYRYWFCQSFNGWFVGAHLMGGQFNAGGVKLPVSILDDFEDRRYEGWFVGGGLTAGYQWPLSKHWNLETSIGLGYDYIKYDQFRCGECGEKTESGHANYWGVTKAAVSIMYMF